MKHLKKISLCMLATCAALNVYAAPVMPKGDGVMVFSTASDIGCMNDSTMCPVTTQNGVTNTYVPLIQRMKNNPNIMYIMPSAGSVTAYPVNKTGSNVLGCPVKGVKPNVNAPLTLFSESLLYQKFSGMTGQQQQCYNLSQVVKAYKAGIAKQLVGQKNAKAQVLPLITVDTLWYPGKQKDPNTGKAFTRTVVEAESHNTAIGAALAKQIILAGADGVSIDYETKFPGTVSLENKIQMGVAFIKGLESEPGMSDKIIAIFDGASAIAAASSTPNNFTNLVEMYSTYDLGNYNIHGPAQAMNLDEYKGLLSSSTTKSRDNTINYHIMFTLPASATDTLYSSMQVYDMDKYAEFAQNDSKYQPTTGMNGNYPTQACPQLQASSTEAKALSEYVCVPQNPDATGKTPYGCQPQSGAAGVQAFLKYDPGNTDNACANYQNTTVSEVNNKTPMVQYFNAALAAVKSGCDNNDKCLGMVLYSDRSPYFDDYEGAKSYFSSYLGQTSLLKEKWISEPVEIPNSIWQSLKSST